jgi:hypothetical protein
VTRIVNMNVTNNQNVDRCPTCGLSKDPETADLVHVRLGLDEAPEPLVCKCKPSYESVAMISTKMIDALAYGNIDPRMNVDNIVNVNINTAVVASISRVPIVEVEARMNAEMSKVLYGCMVAEMFGSPSQNKIVETGCSWWTGPGTNVIAKLRSRSGEGMVAKMLLNMCKIMPGITIAISHEYAFRGEIMRPEYTTTMNEYKLKTVIENIPVTMIARKYECEDTVSYASELEFQNGVTHMQMRTVISKIINVSGSITTLKKNIEHTFMNEVRHADHDVVDVTNLDNHRGVIMHKVDGVKVYVFSYASGYIITHTNQDLTVIMYNVALIEGPIYECTNTPDVMVAEMMVDGTLVYIDTLALDGEALPKPRDYIHEPITPNVRPPMIVRKSWNSVRDVSPIKYSSMEADGIVCVTKSRTLRMKVPTVDLMYRDGKMYASEVGNMVAISEGHESMTNGAIYEMTVKRGTDDNTIEMSNPTMRLIKNRPNNTDIIRRAFTSVIADTSISTILYDVTIMSFKMRKRTYEMAQTNASMGRHVIVSFGAGRFQEINEMALDKFSYIAIDPNIDIGRIKRNRFVKRIVPYDVNRSLSKQLISITKKPGCVLYFAGRSEDFMRQPDVITTMSVHRIPAVFSFSISYHIMVINSLTSSNVSVYGCGFVHDNMPMKGVGNQPVTMNVIKSSSGRSYVKTVFGKSTYEEPILRMNSVENLHKVRDTFPEIWSDVDSSTIEIMDRAVLMY